MGKMCAIKIPPALKAVRINASAGYVWSCSPAMAGVLAHILTDTFIAVLNGEMGCSADANREDDREWIRRELRLPLLNFLFRDMDYGVWKRQSPIESTRDLTWGEATALRQLLESDSAREALLWFIRTQIQLPRLEQA